MVEEGAELQGQTHRECPFPDCDWQSRPYDPDDYCEDMATEHEATMHYEREHAGRVRFQVTIEYEQLLCDRDLQEARKALIERFEEKGHSVAFVRSEVIEESDDHSKINREVAQEDLAE